MIMTKKLVVPIVLHCAIFYEPSDISFNITFYHITTGVFIKAPVLLVDDFGRYRSQTRLLRQWLYVGYPPIAPVFLARLYGK